MPLPFAATLHPRDRHADRHEAQRHGRRGSGGRGHDTRPGIPGASHARPPAHGDRLGGQRRAGRHGPAGGAPRRPGDHPGQPPLQAGVAGVARGRHRGDARQRHRHRRARDRGDGRPVLGRVGGADHGGGAAGGGCGRDHPARGRLQAAHVAVLLPGAGGRGPEAAGARPRGDRTRHRDRSPRPGQLRCRGGIHRHRADRRPQHAALPAAAEGGALPAARCC